MTNRASADASAIDECRSMRIVLLTRQVLRAFHQLGRVDWTAERSGRRCVIVRVICRSRPGCDCDECQNGSNPKRDDFSHLMVPSQTRGRSPSGASRLAGVLSCDLLNCRVRDASAGRVVFLCPHRACYPVDRRFPSRLVRLTAGPHEHALPSNQSSDALFGFRRKSSRALDFGSEPLESNDLLGASVGRNKDECRKSNRERCAVTQARQRRMESGGDARGSGIETRACVGNGEPVSCEDSHVGLLVLSKITTCGCHRRRDEHSVGRVTRESAGCWTVVLDPLKVLGSGS
jgi:hypothetical protein